METFDRIKQIVHSNLPSATVLLFGSRASNTYNSESDWDILILDKHPVNRKIKRKVQDALYPFSLEIEAFINIILANETEWNENPAYYSIRLSISRKPVLS
jgi:predicted nucleotidyltransferase